MAYAHAVVGNLAPFTGGVPPGDISRPHLQLEARSHTVEHLVTVRLLVLSVLVKIDDSVSAQEELILQEVDGLLFGYVNDTDEQAKFAVVIAPQSGDQDSAIAALLPDVEKTEVAGGSAYMVGSFYSQDYANVICNQYRALGFFTIDIVHESPETA